MNNNLRAITAIFALLVPGTVFAQTVSIQTPTTITSTSAIFHGVVTPSNQVTTVWFLWGKTAGVYSDSAEAIESPVAGTTAQNVSDPVSSLKVNTTYYVLLSATSSAGYVQSNEISFTTTALAPTLSSVNIIAKTDTAYLSFAVIPNNAATTISVGYGLTTSYGLTASVTPSTANGDTITNVAAVLGALVPYTTYHYQVSAGNIGGTTTTNDSTITTKSLPPTISSFSPTAGKAGIQVTINGSNFDATTNIMFQGDGTLIRTLTGQSAPVKSVAFSPDGQTVASGGGDRTIKIWGLTDGTLIRTLIGQSSNVTSVAFSPDGQTVASGSLGGIRLWGVTDGTLDRFLSGLSGAVNSVAFSPDGQTVAGGSTDQTIKLWRVSDGTLIRTLTGHSSAVNSVAFSPDGQTVASGSTDRTIKLWRVTDGTLVRTLTGHSSTVFSVAFSPYGQTLASGSADATSKLWLIRNKSTISILSSSSLTAVVPPNSETGKITVGNSGGFGFSANDFTFYAQPIITSFTPATGVIGTAVTINGRNFTGTSSVTFGSIAASSFNVVSDTVITATASTGGLIAVSAEGGDTTSNTPFIVPPLITTGDVQNISDTTCIVQVTLNPKGSPSITSILLGKSSGQYTDTITVNSQSYQGQVDSILIITLNNLSASTTYYYRGYSHNTAGFSKDIEKSFKTVIATPKLSFPSNAAGNVSTIPSSGWSMDVNVDYYHLQVALDSSFNQLVFEDSLLTINTSTISSLNFLTKYFWRVQSRNNISRGSYSKIFSFTTIIQAPSIPALLSPADSSSGQSTSLTLQWSPAARADKYHLQVTTDTTLLTSSPSRQQEIKQRYRPQLHVEATTFIVNDSTLTGTSYALSSLTNSTSYYWRVSANNINGTSGYSTMWRFTTILATPVLQLPANNATNTSVTPALNWNAVSGTTNYQLQLSADSTFATPAVNDSSITTNSSQVNPLSYSTKYYWRVRAKNALSNSAYSSVFSFTTIIQAPSAPALLSPIDGSSGQPTTITLQWNAGARAEKYHLQVSTDTLTNSFTVNDSTIAATTKVVSGLLQSTKYYWKVRSINVGGISNFSPYRSFITNVDGPTFVTAVAGNHKSTVSWIQSTAPNIASYFIYRGTTSPASVLRDSSFSSTYVDSGLENGTKYFYRVTAINSYGNESSFSNEVSATPFNLPPVAVKLQNINENNAGRVLKKTFSYSSLGSHDTDGRIDSVQWYVNDIYFSKADSLIYDYTQGTTKVMLRVFDSDKASDSSVAYVNRTLFMTEVNGPVYGGVTLLGDSILYAVASGDAVYRMDNNGKIIYPLQVGGEVRSASSISNDHVVYIASSDKDLYAFGSSGTAIWPARPQGAVVSASVTIDTIANRLYLGIQNRNFVAVNRSDGSNVWNFFSDAPIAQSAVINADRTLIFSTTKGTIYGIDLNNLPSPVAPTWTLSIGDTITTSPAIDIQRAYYVGTSGGSIIKFVKIQNQQPNIVWQFPTKGRIEASPIIDGAGILYVGSTDSSLYAINSATGGLKWIYKTNGKIKTTGAVTNQRVVYVGNESGELIALDSLGNRIWYYKADSSISSAIVANKGSLYFGTYGKKVIGIFDGGSQTQQLGKGAVLSEPQWGTFQGNNQRTGVQSSTLLYVQNQEKTPISFTLSQNYPNPFNPSTTLQYGIPITSRVSLRIYNVLGQLVADLIDGEQAAGWYSVRWNADVSTGIYFYLIDAVSVNDPNNRFVQVKKMLLLK